MVKQIKMPVDYVKLFNQSAPHYSIFSHWMGILWARWAIEMRQIRKNRLNGGRTIKDEILIMHREINVCLFELEMSEQETIFQKTIKIHWKLRFDFFFHCSVWFRDLSIQYFSIQILGWDFAMHYIFESDSSLFIIMTHNWKKKTKIIPRKPANY